ncbi:MAG: serine hydrolase [Clostridia bacterium]|nr:serine hydrolase [Clostridia bacterium]
MEKWKKRAVNLLTSLAFGSETSPSVVPYYPQKTRISSDEYKYFPRSIPERHGISSRRIYSMLCALESERRANIHGLMIISGGEVISECTKDGYDVNMWRLSHSMSKTVTGMAIGLLCDEGRLKLSDRIVEIFPEITYKDRNFPLITVEHLLAMTSGVTFGEAGSVTETEWTAAYFASPVKFTPGTEFAYNSMNSYILARIVTKISGVGVVEYLRPRLFDPLHIINFFWELSPEGIVKGGWGLYMSMESWAKLGQLVLQGGVFEGRRIFSEWWVGVSTKKQANSPLVNGDFNYGYHLWVGREDDDVLFNGMLGQNVWVCPKNRLVVVMICGNNELFQDSPALEIIRRHLGCDIRDTDFDRRDARVLREREVRFFDCRRFVVPLKKKRGFLYWLGVRRRSEYDDKWDNLLGEYVFSQNNVGILPLFIRAMQNNLDSRLEFIRFERSHEELYFTFSESGFAYRIEIGLYEYKDAVLDFRGERYILRTLGEAVVNSDGETEYRIEIVLPELPNTRMMRVFIKSEDEISVEFTENPNNRMADALLDRAMLSPAISIGVELLERRFGDSFINKKIADTFAPVLVGAKRSSERFDDILAAERARAEEQSRAVKLMRAFVSRFFAEDVYEDEKGKTGDEIRAEQSKNIFTDILDRIRAGLTAGAQPKQKNEQKETDESPLAELDARGYEKKKISQKRADRYSKKQALRDAPNEENTDK